MPSPNVDSKLITFIPKKNVPNIQKQDFIDFIKFSFSHRRKFLISTISKNYSIPKNNIEDIFKKLNLDISYRPENLSVSEWYELFKCFLQLKQHYEQTLQKTHQ